MAKYRKKPVVIEAVQIRPDNDDELLAFLCDHNVPFEIIADHTLTISTLEGDMVASPGDWIIKGVAGEFYPCKPDIFEATYEHLEEAMTFNLPPDLEIPPLGELRKRWLDPE